MKALLERTQFEGIKHHERDPVRVYVDDSIQATRIQQTVGMAQRALATLGPGRHSVLELGCGTADISGQLSVDHEIIGIDCNPLSIAMANRRWLRGSDHDPYYAAREIPSPEAQDIIDAGGDLVILCELLEHMTDPIDLVERCLPNFKLCVISHPLDGDLRGDLSGGDHCWSLSREDFFNWFNVGGHSVEESREFSTGEYKIGLGWGKRTL